MVGFSTEPVTVHLTFATFSLPRLWATCWECVTLHHQTQTATLDQRVPTAATDVLHSKTTRKKKSVMQQLTSCLLAKFLSQSKKALHWHNQMPTKQRSTLKWQLPNQQLKICNQTVSFHPRTRILPRPNQSKFFL